MTTSATMRLTSAISNDDPLSIGQTSYFRTRTRNKFHRALLKLFLQLKSADDLSRADLARRLNKRPEQITRWLSSPGNLTIDTFSDLLLAMKHEVTIETQPIELTNRSNEFHYLAGLTSEVVSSGSNVSISNLRRPDALLPTAVSEVQRAH